MSPCPTRGLPSRCLPTCLSACLPARPWYRTVPMHQALEVCILSISSLCPSPLHRPCRAVCCAYAFAVCDNKTHRLLEYRISLARLHLVTPRHHDAPHCLQCRPWRVSLQYVIASPSCIHCCCTPLSPPPTATRELKHHSTTTPHAVRNVQNTKDKRGGAGRPPFR